MKTLSEAIRDWMVNYKRTSVKASTYDRLEISLTLMEKYPIADIPVENLTADALQKYVNKLVDDGYALSTIKKQAYLIGEFANYCDIRSIRKVKLPKESSVRKHKREVIAYTRDEQDALMEILSRGDSPAYYAAILMLETGMRAGEALALGWSDIDWRRKSLRICKTIVNLGNSKQSFVQNSAKSYSSNRTIALSSRAYDLLKYMRSVDDFDEFVFHNERGDHLNYEAVRWWIKKACNKAGIPYYGMHVFRHTFATNCYEKGCDVKVLSKFLGHSDVTITYNIYIHLFGDALEEMRLIVG